jgi:ribosomal protein S18 acetylase RimI-like enzyme
VRDAAFKTVEIREASAADARAIGEVHVGSWRAAYAGLLSQATIDSHSVDSRSKSWLASFESGELEATWLAEVGGTVVGFALTGRAGDADLDPVQVGEIYAMYVLPDAWGAGVGRMLLQRTVTDFRARGYRRAVLWVLESNARARRFYEAQGWKADGASKPYCEGERAPAVRYETVLGSGEKE